ncbi:uncharacterized protein [Physcomitrium patens]|uniref:uncharacterized protein isoform X2 n=1 Tax=Physcomitrium patens TaxID=3218 RepID=UPI003CCCC399
MFVLIKYNNDQGCLVMKVVEWLVSGCAGVKMTGGVRWSGRGQIIQVDLTQDSGPKWEVGVMERVASQKKFFFRRMSLKLTARFFMSFTVPA